MNAPMRTPGLAPGYDVVVVGAGPAGLAAAAVAAKSGLSTLLLDENATPGGQVYRGITSTPLKNRALLGPEYDKGRALVEAVQASNVAYVPAATVWHLDQEMMLGVSVAGASQLVKAGRVIIATGALERPFPIPGWTLPGVMTIGAGQTLLKASGMVPEGRVTLAGQGPLLWLYAAQVLRAGGVIDVIFDTAPRSNWSRALPHAVGFLLSPYFAKGLGLMREVTTKTKVIRNVTALEALGESKLEALRYTAGGKAGEIVLDSLFLHQGVVPNVNLAMAAGIEHRWNDEQLCFTPVLDQNGKTNVSGIFLCGDGAGIGGAEAAAERGRLAAIAAVREIKPDAPNVPDASVVARQLARTMRGRAFLDALFRPSDQFRIPREAETIVCRCEEVTAGQIRDSVAVGATGPNQMKAYRRCGMGPCQGRLCGLTVTEVMADARGLTAADIGYYRLRSPVKPVTLQEIASIPQDEASVGAVVR